jgi:hypothetical protein
MRGRKTALWTVAALLAVNVALVGAQLAGGALPRGLGAYLLGPKLVRAEVLIKDETGLHDYRVDRGVIRAKAPGSLTLRERDGTLATLPVASDAAVTINGRFASFPQLRRGMVATVIREGDQPVSEVRATGR